MAERVCRICDGMGMRIVERADRYPLAELCECRVERRNAEMLRRSRIPARYRQCTLENYEFAYQGADASLWNAHNHARNFVNDYLPPGNGVGILFTGAVGTGKTHLAVAILQALVLTKGVRALFCDQGELLRQVGNSYNKSVSTTEMDVLRPVLEAELLVIDELGRFNKTEWVSDIVAHVLNTRYNDKLTTIITTNYPNRPPGRAVADLESSAYEERLSPPLRERQEAVDLKQVTYDDLLNKRDMLEGRRPAPAAPEAQIESRLKTRFTFAPARSAAASPASAPGVGSPEAPKRTARVRTEETLGERIGERMRSRLAEMCVTVELTGADYRLGAKKARFR